MASGLNNEGVSAGIGSITLDCSSLQEDKSLEVIKNIPPPLVGIIGAGIAGLKASQVLLERGCNVIIFEARDRIGGRVNTSNYLGKDVDLGPNWIHGTSENPIVPLSELAQSKLANFGGSCPVFDADGKLLDQDEADKLQNMFWQIIEDATEYSKKFEPTIPAEKSLYDYGVDRADIMVATGMPLTPEKSIERIPINRPESPILKSNEGSRMRRKEHEQKELLLDMMHMWGIFVGTIVTRQSLKFFLLEEPVEGPNLFVASTYKPMIDILSKPALEADIIRLCTPIKTITTNTIDLQNSAERRILLAGSNSTYSVDSVIVTIPLGCLKNSAITFNPPLPERIQQSISSLGYGRLEKVYISFPKAFWFSVGAPGFYSFLRPKYAAKTNPNRWHMCCFSLAHLPEPYDQPTLLFYLFEPASEYLTSSEFPSPRTDRGLKQYTQFFEPYFSRLGGYQPGSEHCTPTGVVVTGWGKDVYAGFGSYSNFQVGLIDGENDIEAFREGIQDRRIWFAGEHTAPVLGLGSVSGAYWSGEAAAEKVINSFKTR